jgi:hypothetical protein
MTPLHRLTALGTSVWIDGLVPPAELERLVHEDAVTGLTSNPTIFRAAVLGSDRYATRIAALARRPPPAVYEALAIEDVQAPPMCWRPCTSAPMAPTASSASRSRRRSPTTPTAPSRPRASCGRAPSAPTP